MLQKYIKGITLIELFVIIMILSIVLIIIIARVSGMTDKARERTTKQNIKNIKVALEHYCLTHQIPYPTDLRDTIKILTIKFSPEAIPSALLRRDLHYCTSNEIRAGTIPTGEVGGWLYVNVPDDPFYGGFYINTTVLDTEGIPYSDYLSHFW